LIENLDVSGVELNRLTECVGGDQMISVEIVFQHEFVVRSDRERFALSRDISSFVGGCPARC
jgi:hypothetical protein